MTKVEQLILMYEVEIWGDFFAWSKASDNIPCSSNHVSHSSQLFQQSIQSPQISQ